MLFTAPAFIFVFLPLSMLFLVLFGKSKRKLSLFLVCAVFHILLVMDKPINIIWLPMLTVYSYFAARLPILKKKRIFGTVAGIVPLVWLVVMRQLAYAGDIAYPVGITLPAMCAAAYIWDVCDGEPEEKSFFELLIYILFFPIMIIGPFLSYSRFKALFGDGDASMSLEGCASGFKLFAAGFIKRIAIGAVLIEGYSKIFAYSWESPNIATVILLLVLVYFGAFFSLSGYYDMATGISRIYGVNVPKIKANPFTVATVNEYSQSLFGGIREWTEGYVIKPISRLIGREVPAFAFIAIVCVLTAIFIRADLLTTLMCIPLIAYALCSAALRLDRSYKRGRTGLRVLFGMLTVLVLGAFWVFITMNNGTASVLDYLDDITSGNAEYQTDMILISFSAVKYAAVIIIGVLLLLPQSDMLTKKYECASERVQTVIDYVSLMLLLLLFVFTVVFFLPQFSVYNYAPFGYILV